MRNNVLLFLINCSQCSSSFVFQHLKKGNNPMFSQLLLCILYPQFLPNTQEGCSKCHSQERGRLFGSGYVYVVSSTLLNRTQSQKTLSVFPVSQNHRRIHYHNRNLWTMKRVLTLWRFSERNCYLLTLFCHDFTFYACFIVV